MKKVIIGGVIGTVVCLVYVLVYSLANGIDETTLVQAPVGIVICFIIGAIGGLIYHLFTKQSQNVEGSMPSTPKQGRLFLALAALFIGLAVLMIGGSSLAVAVGILIGEETMGFHILGSMSAAIGILCGIIFATVRTVKK